MENKLQEVSEKGVGCSLYFGEVLYEQLEDAKDHIRRIEEVAYDDDREYMYGCAQAPDIEPTSDALSVVAHAQNSLFDIVAAEDSREKIQDARFKSNMLLQPIEEEYDSNLRLYNAAIRADLDFIEQTANYLDYGM